MWQLFRHTAAASWLLGIRGLLRGKMAQGQGFIKKEDDDSDDISIIGQRRASEKTEEEKMRDKVKFELLLENEKRQKKRKEKQQDDRMPKKPAVPRTRLEKDPKVKCVYCNIHYRDMINHQKNKHPNLPILTHSNVMHTTQDTDTVENVRSLNQADDLVFDAPQADDIPEYGFEDRQRARRAPFSRDLNFGRDNEDGIGQDRRMAKRGRFEEYSNLHTGEFAPKRARDADYGFNNFPIHSGPTTSVHSNGHTLTRESLRGGRPNLPSINPDYRRTPTPQSYRMGYAFVDGQCDRGSSMTSQELAPRFGFGETNGLFEE